MLKHWMAVRSSVVPSMYKVLLVTVIRKRKIFSPKGESLYLVVLLVRFLGFIISAWAEI